MTSEQRWGPEQSWDIYLGQCCSLGRDTRLAYKGMVVGALLKMPVSDRLGLGKVSFQGRVFPQRLKFIIILFRCSWSSGLSSRLQGFLSSFLHTPFRLSLYHLLLEWYFRSVIKHFKRYYVLLSRSRMPLRMISLRLFKKTEDKMGCIR
jgi:hypothetical protein